jgi:phosphoglycolate phosphatase-like HAD superfamily hydrolase
VRLVLFDIDGTLLLSGGAGLLALERAFAELYGVEDAARGVEYRGLTDPVIVQSIARARLARELDEAEFAAVVECYLRHLADTLRESVGFRTLPGARELVRELFERDDVALGLVTGNFEPAAWRKLERAELRDFFSFGGFGSDAADRAEVTRIAVRRGRSRAGANGRVVVIGDTTHDVTSAARVGIPCLAVATGNATVDELRAAGAQWAVSGLADPLVREVLELDGAPRGPARTR